MFHRVKRLSLRIKTIVVYVTVGYIVCLSAMLLLHDLKPGKDLKFGTSQPNFGHEAQTQPRIQGARGGKTVVQMKQESKKRTSRHNRHWVPGMKIYFLKKQKSPTQENSDQSPFKERPPLRMFSKPKAPTLHKHHSFNNSAIHEAMRRKYHSLLHTTPEKWNHTVIGKHLQRKKLNLSHLERHPVIRQFLQTANDSSFDVALQEPEILRHNLSHKDPDSDKRFSLHNMKGTLSGHHQGFQTQNKDVKTEFTKHNLQNSVVSQNNKHLHKLDDQEDKSRKSEGSLRSLGPGKLETFTVYQFDDSDVAVNTLAKPQLVQRHRVGGGRGKKPGSGRRRSHLTPPVVTNLDGNPVTGHMVVQ